MTIERNMLMAAAGVSTGPVVSGPFIQVSTDYYAQSVAASPVTNNFMVVGYNGSTYEGLTSYSSDGGVTFPTPSVVGPDSYMYSVACGASGKWIAAGQQGASAPYSGSIWVSTDNGASWTETSLFGNASLASIGTDGSGTWIFAVTQAGGSGWYRRSTDDGVTWSAAARYNGYTGAFNVISVVYSNGRWVCFGYSNSFTSMYTTSTDGTTWTTPTNISAGNYFAQSMDADNNGVFIGGGRAWTTTVGNAQGGFYTRSSDGTTWSAPSVLGSFTTSNSAIPVYIPTSNKFFAVASSTPIPDILPYYYLSSDAGVTWGLRTTLFPSLTSGYFNAITATCNSLGRVVVVDDYWSYGSITGL